LIGFNITSAQIGPFFASTWLLVYFVDVHIVLYCIYPFL